jgi:hypothetical protein
MLTSARASLGWPNLSGLWPLHHTNRGYFPRQGMTTMAGSVCPTSVGHLKLNRRSNRRTLELDAQRARCSYPFIALRPLLYDPALMPCSIHGLTPHMVGGKGTSREEGRGCHGPLWEEVKGSHSSSNAPTGKGREDWGHGNMGTTFWWWVIGELLEHHHLNNGK